MESDRRAYTEASDLHESARLYIMIEENPDKSLIRQCAIPAGRNLMRLRHITAEKLDLFIEAGGRPEDHEPVKRYLKEMFAAGSMRPQWCFVDEDASGRVALWGLPSQNEPFALVLLDSHTESDFETVGADLLEAMKVEAARLGTKELEHVIDSPPGYPQFQHDSERRARILEDAGFTLKRETIRFAWAGGKKPEPSERLDFRPLPEVGEEAFVEAMVRVSEGTLDREILAERASLGPGGAARDFFEDSLKVDHDPDWWRLAYTPGGELVGLVMPANAPAFLTVFYVGVVPGMRGRGYVDDLLATGTATLLDARPDENIPLIADTDVANAPMAASFERTGWREFARRSEFSVDLRSHSNV